MFKHSSETEKKCKECNQTVSSIEHLIGDNQIISYNEKTSTWTKRSLKNGNTKA